MKKIITLTALVLAAILVTVGCANTGTIGKLVDGVVQGQKDDISDIFQGIVGEEKTEPQETETPPQDPGNIQSPALLYDEYMDAKTNLIFNINGAINNNPELGYTYDPSLGNIFEVDAIMWAAIILWDNTGVVEQTGRFFGMTDFKVDRGKDQVKLSYTNEDDKGMVLTASYDEATDHYIFTSEHENGDKPYMELVRTPYGIAGQTYMGGTGMLQNLYLISIQGENGIIGIIHDTDPPAPLTGKEAFDFPKGAGEWYHYEDGKLTGISRDGEAISSP